MSRKLSDKSVTNVFWSYVSFFSTKALNLVAIVIVARYVSPAEFGLMAFGLVIIGYFELVQGFGLGAFLISTRHDMQEAAEAVFGFSVAASVAMAGTIWLSADLIAGYFEQPPVAEILRFLAIGLLIESLATVHNTLLQRELRFRLKVIPEIARGLTKGLLAIALALLGFGVWSLVYGYVAGMLAWTLALFIVRPWRPRRMPRPAMIWTALRFGGNILVGGLARAVQRTADQLFIGKMLGPAALGLYAVAMRMPQLAIRTMSMEAGKVFHPVMAQIQTDETALRAYYYGLVRYTGMVAMPAGAALAAVTDPLVRVLYTPEWLGVVAPMQLLSLGFAIGFVNMLPGTLYKAINRSDYFMITPLIKLPVILLLFWLLTPYGIEAVAASHIAIILLGYAPHAILLRRAVGVTVAGTLRAMAPGALCALLVGLAGLGAAELVPSGALWRLAATSAAAGLVWLAALAVLGPEALAELRRLVMKKAFGR